MHDPVSIIIPCHNEADRISDSIGFLQENMARSGRQFEIILAEDGSTDETGDIVEDLAADDDRVSCFRTDRRIGLGASLARGIRAAQHDTILYMDADMATGLDAIETAIAGLDTHDIVIGSRRVPGHSQDRPAQRDIVSTVFNGLLRVLFRSKIYDHNCGFKAFRRPAVMPLLDDISNTHFFWETELLLRAQRNGLLIKEIPVEWTPQESSSVNVLTDGARMFGKMLALRARFTYEAIRR